MNNPQGLVNSSSDSRTRILENLLVQKLLVAQAKIDSIEVTDTEVENALNSQLEQYVQHIGSRERLETYFGKSYEDIKNEMRTPLREQMITQRMQSKIVENVRVTPSEVRYFYRKFNKDSLPEVPDKYEIQQIVIKPRISDTEKERIRNRLREFREEILAGKQTFNTLAVLYSEDPGFCRQRRRIRLPDQERTSPSICRSCLQFETRPSI